MATIVGARSPLFYKQVRGGLPAILDTSKFTGNIFFVDSNGGGADSDGYGSEPSKALLTIDFAIGLCTANQGDVILVLPGHAETLTAAGAITCDVAGITILGLGMGAARPTLTFGTVVGASVVVSAASVKILNILGVAALDSLTNPFHIQAADCELDIEWRDGSAAIEAVRALLTTAAADRLKVSLRYLGQTGGDACVNAIRLVGCNGGSIAIDFYGKASTAIVEFLTTACSDISIRGRMYNSGITDGSKDVVDTVTGSTWDADIFDAAAGMQYSGGSGNALQAGPTITAAEIATGAVDGDAIADGAIDAGAIAADAITNAKIADNAFASEQFALSAGEKTTDGIVVTRATAALPQTAAAAIFTVTGLVLVRRIVGYVTIVIGAVANATKLVGNSTGAGASTDLCAALDINAHAVDSRYEITGTFANPMVRTLDVPLALTQAVNIVIPPGTIDLNCAGSDGGTGRVRWAITYVPLEAGAQIVAA